MLDAAELCSCIAGTKLKNKAQYQKLPESLQLVFPQPKFPCEASGNVKLLKKTDSVVMIPGVSQSINFSLSFDPLMLKVAIESMPVTPDYSALIILHYFIAAVTEGVFEIQKALVILDGLDAIIKSAGEIDIPKIREMANSAFYNFYVSMVNSGKVTDMTGFFTPMVQFLTLCDVPSEAFEIIPLLIGKIIANKGELTRQAATFLNFCTIIIRNRGGDVPDYVKAKLVDAIQGFVVEMNYDALRFLQGNILYLSQNVSHIVLSFPSIIKSMIENMKPVSPKTAEEGLVLLEMFVGTRFGFTENSIFDSNAIPLVPKFPEPVLLCSEMQQKLRIVSEIVCGCTAQRSEIINSVTDVLMRDGMKISALTEAMLILLSGVSPLSRELVMEIFKSDLFNGSITIFGNNCPIISEIRDSAMNLLAAQSHEIIYEVFSFVRRKPFLFGEMVMRILNLNGRLMDASIIGFGNAVLNANYYYMDVACPNPVALQVARGSIFRFLIEVLSNRHLMEILCENNDFVNAFAAIGFEEAVGNVFGDLLVVCARNGIAPLLRKTVKDIFGMFVTAKELTGEGNRFILRSLKWLTRMGAANPNIGNEFGGFVDKMCQFLPRVSPSETSKNILIETISIIGQLVEVSKLTKSDIMAIEAAANHLLGSDFDAELKLHLVSLIAGTHIEKFGTLFEIKQPRAIRLFVVTVYENHMKSLCEVLQWFIDICKMTPMNAIMCHRGELDSLIIEFLERSISDDEATRKPLDSTEVGLIFELFYEIASCASSFVVTSRFISLLCTYHVGYLKPYHAHCINCIQKLLQRSTREPPVALYETHVRVAGIKKALESGRFSIVMWILLTTTSETVRDLVELKSASGSFKLQAKDASLQMTCGTETVALHEVPVGKWNCVVCSVDCCVCTTLLNGEKESVNEFVVPVGVLSDAVVSVTGSSSHWIGSIGMFPYLDASKAREFTDFGYQKLAHLSNPIFNIVPEWSYGDLTVGITKQDGVSVAHTGSVRDQPASFVWMLGTRNGLWTLLPTFAQLDLSFENGTTYTSLLDDMLTIIHECMNLSEIVQSRFASQSGFAALARLLMEASDEKITLQVYMKFYQMLDIMKCHDAKMQLLMEILLNIELWMKADAVSHQEILAHWARTLVPCFSAEITEKWGIGSILAIMRIYYFCEVGIEDPIARCKNARARIDVFDAQGCRNELVTVALVMARYKGLKDEDIKSIISQIIVTEGAGSDALFSLITALIHDEEVIAKSGPLPSIHALNYILVAASHADFDKIWEIVLYAMDHNISKQTRSRDIAALCMAATTVRIHIERNRDRILSAIDPISVVQDPQCLFWVIASAYVSNRIDSVLQYLCSVGDGYWPYIYVFIDLAGRAVSQMSVVKDLKNKIHKFQVEFLNMTADMVTSKEQLAVFAKICERELFFLSNDFRYERMSELCQQILEESHQIAGQRSVSMNAVPRGPTARLRTRPTMSRMQSISRRSSRQLGFPAGTRAVILDETKKSLEKAGKEAINPVYSFGLKLQITHRESGKPSIDMTDVNVAKRFLDLYIEHPDVSLERLVILLLAMLMKMDVDPPKDLRSYAPSITSEEASVVDLYNCVATQYGKPLITQTNMSIGELFERKMMFLDSMSLSQSLMTDLYASMCSLINGKIRNDMNSVVKLIVDLTNISSDLVQDFLNDEITTRRKWQEHAWSKTWKQLIIDNGPWCQALPVETQTRRYKRDFSACYAFCPMREKVNLNFDDHTKESLTRDVGCKLTAEDIIREKHMLRAEKGPPKMFILADEEEIIVTDNALHVLLELECELIDITGSVNAVFLLTVDSIRLLRDNKSTIIKNCDVKHIFLRTQLHRHTAIEIFENDGRCHFINFMTHASTVIDAINKIKDRFTSMQSLQLKDFKPFFQSHDFTKKWVNREISNFEYLMLLNIYSGRSFRNPFQYPFLPWVIADYSSDHLDLSNDAVFRDLTKPVGVLSEEKKLEAISTYNQYKEAGMTPYMFSSAPISPLTLYYWLLRIEPFTTMHVDIQSGRFDEAARLFRSVGVAWDLVLIQKGDFKEVVPEFYTCPEFLVNQNEFDLGQVDGHQISDVELPPWADTPMDFVYKMRKALECDHVSRSLHNWIDLVWGDKQTGDKAYDSLNVFKAEMYPSVWETDGANDLMRVEIETILSYVGQIPQQLFDSPHPVRCADFISKSEPHVRRFQIETTSRIVAASVIPTEHSFVIKVACENGDVITTRNSETVVKMLLPSCIYKHGSGESHFTFSGNGMLVLTSNVSQSGTFLCSTEMQRWSLFREQTLPVSIIATDGDLTATVNIDAVLMVFQGSQLLCNVPSFKQNVKCCAVSDAFHVAVCGTLDGSLMLCALHSSSFYRTINVGENARVVSVMITPAWGFIVAHVKEVEDGRLVHYVCAYTINGMFIYKKKLKSGIRKWCCWKSRSGFDFIMFSDENDDVRGFEVYYGDVQSAPIASFRSPVVSIGYSVAQSTALVVTEDANVHAIPPSKCHFTK